MSYKYKALKQLAGLIRTGQVPEDIDVKKALLAYNEKLNKPKTVRPTWKPRFYDRALVANTRARQKGKTGKITADDLEFVYKKYNGKCANCGSKEHFVFDHIVSYWHDGENTVDNLQVLCRTCNMLKGAN